MALAHQVALPLARHQLLHVGVAFHLTDQCVGQRPVFSVREGMLLRAMVHLQLIVLLFNKFLIVPEAILSEAILSVLVRQIMGTTRWEMAVVPLRVLLLVQT
jgi:hypothetical protein